MHIKIKVVQFGPLARWTAPTYCYQKGNPMAQKSRTAPHIVHRIESPPPQEFDMQGNRRPSRRCNMLARVERADTQLLLVSPPPNSPLYSSLSLPHRWSCKPPTASCRNTREALVAESVRVEHVVVFRLIHHKPFLSSPHQSPSRTWCCASEKEGRT